MTDEENDKSGLGLLVAVIGGCATIFGFLTSYGLLAIGILIAICSFLALFQLRKGRSFVAWLQRAHPTILVGGFGLLLVVGVGLAVLGLFTSHSLFDLFRPEYGSKPIDKNSYLGSAAPWSILPPAGTAADSKVAYRLDGWKRLINAGVISDPQNSGPKVVIQLLYVESVVFDRGYKSLNVELELPTMVEIVDVFAFLSHDSTPRSSHQQLESLRTECPLGVDRNRADIFVPSPNAGEKLVVFVVASSKNKQPFPKDVESNIALRSIK